MGGFKYIMKLKNIIFMIMTVFFLCVGTANAKDITVMINNREMISEQKPIMQDGRTLVPLRAICEAMDCTVMWFASENAVNISSITHVVTMQIDSPWINKKERVSGEVTNIEMDTTPILYNDTTYIPLRALAEALDATVGWDEVTQTVMIIYDTDLRYTSDRTISVFAGTGEKIRHDSSNLLQSSFVSPESIDIADDGTIYVGDSGCIRVIKPDGSCSTIELSPDYLTVSILRCYGNDIYALTNEFQDEYGIKYYGLVRLNENTAEGLFITEAAYSKIPDFCIDDSGTMYVIQDNVGTGQKYVGSMDIYTGEVTYIAEVDAGITAICADNRGGLYLGNSVKGSIYRMDIASGEIKLFAGVDDNIKFVDGPNPMFVEPRAIKFDNGYLYILDYNILRRIQVNSANMAINAETVAGKLTADANPDTVNGKASDAEIAPSYLMDFVVNGNEILLTDPKHAVIRCIK